MKELFTKGCSIEKKLPTPGVFPQHPKRALHQECVCVCVGGGGGSIFGQTSHQGDPPPGWKK